eukprot:CAMPEP_0172909942 /NCGR_PEP_ID=MMETSP1075-20121228/183693_1 /TAXON_ID=2916 /ORGANISM="Ceratium fusus, Strain PA161109" /LENGTH=45 /DNA_ID= /DNA_START= /DNA_END= /DNA_ORIENTATION=
MAVNSSVGAGACCPFETTSQATVALNKDRTNRQSRGSYDMTGLNE